MLTHQYPSVCALGKVINDVNIFPLDQSAARRLRALLVLRYKVVRTDLVADPFQRIQILVFGMQGFTIFAVIRLRSTDRNDASPVAMAGKESFWKPPLSCAKPVRSLTCRRCMTMIMTLRFLSSSRLNSGALEPVVGFIARAVRIRLFGLDRVVNDDEIAPAPGQRPADRGRVTEATLIGYKLVLGGFSGLDMREDFRVPRALHNALKIACERFGQLIGITDTDDLCAADPGPE